MRSTRATRAVLAMWESRADALLSEADVEAALHAQGVEVNRVTVYRLLDRLAAAGVLRRSVDAARVARYGRSVPGAGRQADAAAHFECADCHSAFRLGGEGGGGGEPLCPVIAHFGRRDSHIPVDAVQAFAQAQKHVQVHLYDADHGFNCDQRSAYDEASALQARDRTLAFFDQQLA